MNYMPERNSTTAGLSAWCRRDTDQVHDLTDWKSRPRRLLSKLASRMTKAFRLASIRTLVRSDRGEGEGES
jgi:hypothetical protein